MLISNLFAINKEELRMGKQIKLNNMICIMIKMEGIMNNCLPP